LCLAAVESGCVLEAGEQAGFLGAVLLTGPATVHPPTGAWLNPCLPVHVCGAAAGNTTLTGLTHVCRCCVTHLKVLGAEAPLLTVPSKRVHIDLAALRL
jgi:hypothetical protein